MASTHSARLDTVDQSPPGWVSLAGGAPDSEAAILAEVLTSEGIAVIKRDDPQYLGYGVGSTPQELLVREEDWDAAYDLYSEWQSAEPVFPDDLADE
jgi:hypothetical protein